MCATFVSMLSLRLLKMFSEHIFKGIKLINSSLIFFHIDHLLGHRIVGLLTLTCLSVDAFKILNYLSVVFISNVPSVTTWAAWCERAERLWADMSWFRFQLFCLTADCSQTSDVVWVSQFLHLWNGANTYCEACCED